MADRPPHSEHDSAPPFIKPLLRALDRIQAREALRPEQLTDRARALLAERFGAAEPPVEAAFAHGSVGLLGEHTHYFDGFALCLSLAQGTAVAVRRAGAGVSRVAFEGGRAPWTFDRARDEERQDRPDGTSWACLVEDLVRRLGPAEVQVEVAVVTTVQPACLDAYLAALGVATARALQARFALPFGTTALLRAVREVIAACAEQPFSAAYVVAAEAGRPYAFTLVDADSLDHLPVESPARDMLGWGLVEVERGPVCPPAFYRKQQERADKALALLQRKAFPRLTSFRNLDFLDQPRALDALPRRYRPFVRYLVSENHRVQKLVWAARRRDWQLFGALLLISHASLRNDARSSSAEVDFVVEQVETMTLEGMYGACRAGRGGCILLVGQPFIVPQCLDRIKAAFQERFGHAPETTLL